jgi:hypothetical protein
MRDGALSCLAPRTTCLDGSSGPIPVRSGQIKSGHFERRGQIKLHVGGQIDDIFAIWFPLIKKIVGIYVALN